MKRITKEELKRRRRIVIKYLAFLTLCHLFYFSLVVWEYYFPSEKNGWMIMLLPFIVIGPLDLITLFNFCAIWQGFDPDGPAAICPTVFYNLQDHIPEIEDKEE